MATWKDDIIKALNELGGEAAFTDLYPVLEGIRVASGKELTKKWRQTVQGIIEYNSPDSKTFKQDREPIFYSVSGLGKGVWGLFPKFLSKHSTQTLTPMDLHYAQGLEGILKEAKYLRRSRDPRLVEERKKLDDFTCQVCKYRQEINSKFIIDVHHIHPLGALSLASLTSLEDLICLCPNCHRAAHTSKDGPIPVDVLRKRIGLSGL